MTNDQLLAILKDRLNDGNSTRMNEMFLEMQSLSNKLKRSEALKSNFISNIRNEINNPISSLLGLSRLLMNSEALETKQYRRTAYLIHNEIFNLDFQMRNIFVAAEIEAGTLQRQIRKIDLNKFVKELLGLVNFKASQKQVRIILENAAVTNNFYSDPDKLYIILINLLANAIEYSGHKGEVRFNIHEEEKSIRFVVKDNGKGIDERDQEEIFDRFHQVEGGVTKRHPGHGLGLSVTKELVEILGGCISMKSQPGAGSVFQVAISFLDEQKLDLNQESWSDDLFTNDLVL